MKIDYQLEYRKQLQRNISLVRNEKSPSPQNGSTTVRFLSKSSKRFPMIYLDFFV